MIKFIILEIVFFILATYCLYDSNAGYCSSWFFIFLGLMFMTCYYNFEEFMIIGEKIMQILEFLLG